MSRRSDDTRDRLVAAAARAFNRAGYHGTDSNRIARAAGYAPATFYKHFADKRAIFVAATRAQQAADYLVRLLQPPDRETAALAA